MIHGFMIVTLYALVSLDVRNESEKNINLLLIYTNYIETYIEIFWVLFWTCIVLIDSFAFVVSARKMENIDPANYDKYLN